MRRHNEVQFVSKHKTHLHFTLLRSKSSTSVKQFTEQCNSVKLNFGWQLLPLLRWQCVCVFVSCMLRIRHKCWNIKRTLLLRHTHEHAVRTNVKIERNFCMLFSLFHVYKLQWYDVKIDWRRFFLRSALVNDTHRHHIISYIFLFSIFVSGVQLRNQIVDWIKWIFETSMASIRINMSFSNKTIYIRKVFRWWKRYDDRASCAMSHWR